MTEEQFDDFCNNVTWHWAKTYAKTFPHWYCVREEVGSEKFEDAVKFIRDHKIERMFFSSKYGYYDRGRYTYWTMGNPIRDTTIINKAII